ncbi:hypothetical protein BCAR13_1020005 [Paraburkholderia caribensis]|nr:hypothetical protein BCAR13_1020005 [Paraburkholderia caribensis]
MQSGHGFLPADESIVAWQIACSVLPFTLYCTLAHSISVVATVDLMQMPPLGVWNACCCLLHKTSETVPEEQEGQHAQQNLHSNPKPRMDGCALCRAFDAAACAGRRRLHRFRRCTRGVSCQQRLRHTRGVQRLRRVEDRQRMAPRQRRARHRNAGPVGACGGAYTASVA